MIFGTRPLPPLCDKCVVRESRINDISSSSNEQYKKNNHHFYTSPQYSINCHCPSWKQASEYHSLLGTEIYVHHSKHHQNNVQSDPTTHLFHTGTVDRPTYKVFFVFLFCKPCAVFPGHCCGSKENAVDPLPTWNTRPNCILGWGSKTKQINSKRLQKKLRFASLNLTDPAPVWNIFYFCFSHWNFQLWSNI